MVSIVDAREFLKLRAGVAGSLTLGARWVPLAELVLIKDS